MRWSSSGYTNMIVASSTFILVSFLEPRLVTGAQREHPLFPLKIIVLLILAQTTPFDQQTQDLEFTLVLHK